MLTIKEIQLILIRLGYKLTVKAVRQWIVKKRIEPEIMGGMQFYTLADIMPFIQKRVQTTETEVKELLKDIRTKLSN